LWLLKYHDKLFAIHMRISTSEMYSKRSVPLYAKVHPDGERKRKNTFRMIDCFNNNSTNITSSEILQYLEELCLLQLMRRDRKMWNENEPRLFREI